MEKTVENLGQILDGLSIKPPRLEDAGLEDCALPPHSIMEAFSRAADSLKSRFTDQDDEDGCCVQDPGPTNGDIPDALVDHSDNETLDCGGSGGKVTASEKEGNDEVVVVEGDAAEDRVVVVGEEDGDVSGVDKRDVGSLILI